MSAKEVVEAKLSERLEFAKADDSTLEQITALLKQVKGSLLPADHVATIVKEAVAAQMLHKTDRYFLCIKPDDLALLAWEHAVYDAKDDTVKVMQNGTNHINVFFTKERVTLPKCCGKGLKSTIVGMKDEMIGIAMECDACGKQYGVTATVTTAEELKE